MSDKEVSASGKPASGKPASVAAAAPAKPAVCELAAASWQTHQPQPQHKRQLVYFEQHPADAFQEVVIYFSRYRGQTRD